MEGLRRWMQIVSGFYILMGVFNTPPIIGARISAQYPDLGVSASDAAGRALTDV